MHYEQHQRGLGAIAPKGGGHGGNIVTRYNIQREIGAIAPKLSVIVIQ